MKYAQVAITALIMLFLPVHGFAFVVPGEGVESVEIREVNMAVLHNGKEQTLIVSLDVEVKGNGEVIWVLPIPNSPTRVERAGEMLWAEAINTAQLSHLAPPKRRSEESDDSGPAARVVDGSDIAIVTFPVRGVDAREKVIEDLGEVGKSLGLSYYADRNWTFARMKWNAKEGKQRTAPLIFDFPTPIAVAPVRSLSSEDGVKIMVFQMLGVPPEEDHYLDAHSKGAHITKDRRKGSNWAIASNEWVMGRTVFFAKDLKLLLQNHYNARFTAEGRGYFQAVVFESLTNAQTRKWKEELVLAPRGSSLKMEDSGEAVEAIEMGKVEGGDLPSGAAPEDPSPEPKATSDGEEPAEGAVEGEKEEIAEGAEDEMDWMMIMGIAAIVFLFGSVGIIHIMRSR
jgi:hypothetical protein